ncbi:VOC family protein [Paenibacillus flagellatus]|uniref:Glyoxalase n=1 Tax=Paenibacillus flagellatus TaxID=2211139 RepID=A0A2V5K4C4_9BACL|nr:VOC family protein [Paenibacillus flagellatus]PYI52503.1 glyoxalase [Paenibacillus flagellatus]
MSGSKPMPDGFHTVTPYLHAKGAERLIAFMRQAFDAIETERNAGDAGEIRHATLRIGDSMIEVSEGNEAYPPMPCGLHVYVADTDACYRKALDAGATSLYEPQEMPYGERSAGVKDMCGNHWYIATYKHVGN